MESLDKKRRRALVLMSGGLDSQLAVCVLRDQGIEVEGVSFESPFFSSQRAQQAANDLGVALHIVSFADAIAKAIAHPRYGFGSAMNPCVDCHIAMVKTAGRHMAEWGIDFLATGEVLDQRPMSQNHKRLETVAVESGYSDLLLRPLSATLLPETRPEREGWVDRQALLALHGRSRKPQIALAERYHLKDYPTPAGGCCLTDPNFCGRVKDLRDHDELGDEVALRRLRVGRHFRIGPHLKLIIGRDQKDNAVLEAGARDNEICLSPETIPGPTGLLSAGADESSIRQAAALCAGLSDGRNAIEMAMRVVGSGMDMICSIRPASREEIERVRIT